MQAYHLIPYPARPPLAVTSVVAEIGYDGPDWLRLHWRIDGASKLILPPIVGTGRADELWRTTCFEMFTAIGGQDSAYLEFNLSPSQQWNAYHFDDYREGMRAWDVANAPVCTMRPGNSFATFEAAIPAGALPEAREAASLPTSLAAVIEEEGGVKSYWAIAHPREDTPNFHHRACFAATLPAPESL